MSSTLLLLVTGDQLEVDAPLEGAEKQLENAARSGSGRVAWLTEAGTGARVGVNPAHVVTLRSSEG